MRLWPDIITICIQALVTCDIFAILQCSWIDDAIVAPILFEIGLLFLFRRPTWRTTTLVPFASTWKVLKGSALS